MIVPDITFRDRTCFVFCILGCVVNFQVSEANSWPRSASSNPGNRVCVLFVFLSFLFTLTVQKKYTWLVQTNKGGAKKREKA